MTSITNVLFDADGVIQHPAGYDSWGSLVADPSRSQEFLAHIFDAELPFLTRAEGFEVALANVLERWGSYSTLEEALSVWTTIHPDEDVIDIVKSVAHNGTQIGMATNQEAVRYEYMKSELGYGAIFDNIFVSFEMGIMKPGLEYFYQIIETLNCSSEELLFIDDNEMNVEAAKDVGLNAQTYHLSEGPERMIEILQSYGIQGI